MTLAARLRFYVIPDRGIGRGRDIVEQARLALAGGATAIQLRDKTASREQLVDWGTAMRDLCVEHGALFIVNDHVDIALAVGADGVHLGQDDASLTEARAMLTEGKLIGVSAATLAEAERAIVGGADYLGVGAIYPTASKADARATGVEGLRAICARATIPVVAIGGIGLERVPEVLATGAAGVAVISAVVAADDVAGAARAFSAILK